MSTIVIFLEDLETKAKQGKYLDNAGLDSILASQKEALARCNSVLSCPTCFLRPEYIFLLGMVMERLASLCESTIARYLDGVHDGTPFRETTADERHHSRVNLMDDVKVCIGGCEVETPDERVGLVRMMIGMQLQSLRKSIEGAAMAVASRRDDKTQVLKVQTAEDRLAKLIRQSKS